MDYQSALEYLYSFVDFEAKSADVYAPERFNLERVRALLERLGNPHESYSSVHIAGTKGKGSVAAMVASVLRAAGFKTGLFTSPHLQDFRERIQVGPEPITRDSLAALLTELRPKIAATPDITFFEISAALALECFARQKAELAVLEVGLGGRLDATNVVTPAVCAITPISHDHTGLLGDTIESIATEKAGIIKSGVPLVVAPQPPAAMSVLRERASAVGAPLIDVRAEWIWKRKMHDSTGQRFALMPAARPQDEHFYPLPLLGAHQVENAALAVALVQQLREQGWSVPHRSIAHGLQTVKWPARCEFFPGKPSLMLDCAHNRASARRLVETLQGYFPGLPWVLVFGAMRDKDVPGMFAELLPSCSAAIMTSIGAPRAMLPSELLPAAAAHNCAATAAEDLFGVLAQAKHAATPAGIVVVTGSVALAGAARAAVLEDAALSAAVPL